MRWATVVESQFRELIKRGSPTSTVMQRAVEKLSSPGVRDQAARLSARDWNSEVPVFTNWASEILTRERLPDEVAGLWSSVPEIEMNAAEIGVIGCDAFDQGEWALESIWPAGAADFLSEMLTQSQDILDPGRVRAPSALNVCRCRAAASCNNTPPPRLRAAASASCTRLGPHCRAGSGD